MVKKNKKNQNNKKESKEYSESSKRESSTSGNNSKQKPQLTSAEQQKKPLQTATSGDGQHQTERIQKSVSGPLKQGQQQRIYDPQHYVRDNQNKSQKSEIGHQHHQQQKQYQSADCSGLPKNVKSYQNKSQQSGEVSQQQRQTPYNRFERNDRYQQRGLDRQQGQRIYQQQRYNESISLPQQMQRMSISSEIPIPVKKTSCNDIVRGTLGTWGIVEVNCLKLTIENMPNVAYHYDVTIKPDGQKKFLRPALEQCRLKTFPNVLCAFDGRKSCFTFERLPSQIDCEVEVCDSNNRMKELHVQIKETDNCIIDMSSLRSYQVDTIFNKPMRALQVLGVVLASNNHERGVRAGRSFFRRPKDSADLGDGYEPWTGLFQTVILGEEPLLNVDISHKSFPCKSSLIDYLRKANISLDSGTTKDNFKIVSSFLKGINITYEPPKVFGNIPKQYKIIDLVEPASKRKFKNEEGQQLTIEEYYKLKGYQLMYPHLNCLSVGSSVRPIYLPIELCSITGGQVLNRKDHSRQIDKMITYAATCPNIRKQKILELLKFFDHNVQPIIRMFGIQIGSNFIQVPMRILDAPFIEYLKNQTVNPSNGVWRMDKKKFIICSKPPNGHKWIILYDSGPNCRINEHHLEDFKSNVITMSKSLGMNLMNCAEIKPFTNKNLPVILEDLAKKGYDLVFVVLSDSGTSYSKVKQIAELNVGILTQCIKYTTIKKIKGLSLFGNILLKVNGKLNGTNHKISEINCQELFSPIENVMYLGADVTHPSPGQSNIPSVVGTVASHDQNGACYNHQYRLQKSNLEEIEDMESIVKNHLEVYLRHQKSYPSQIIYYRDGVSDGQFPIIERKEILAIKGACEQLKCKAKVTCIIVVKRHHIRFFPLTTQPSDFKNNVQPGTVVDQHITHPNVVQFFMVSHHSNRGTARPTRYNVIYDEAEFNIDLLQQLTYNLCHLFPRCNRAVSYPAPVYLAHLLAYRGRVYLEGTKNFGDLEIEYNKRQTKEEFIKRNPMYFI